MFRGVDAVVFETSHPNQSLRMIKPGLEHYGSRKSAVDRQASHRNSRNDSTLIWQNNKESFVYRDSMARMDKNRNPKCKSLIMTLDAQQNSNNNSTPTSSDQPLFRKQSSYVTSSINDDGGDEARNVE